MQNRVRGLKQVSQIIVVAGEKKTLLNVLFNKIVNTCHKADRTFYLEKKQNTGHTLGSMRWEHNKSPLLFIRPTYLKYVYLIKVVNLKINTSHKNQWHQYIWNGSLKKKKKTSQLQLCQQILHPFQSQQQQQKQQHYNY